MDRWQLFSVFLLLVLGFLLYQVYLVFAGFLIPAIWAAILALVFYPAYGALLRRLKRAGLAAGIMTLAIYLMVLLPSLTLGGMVVNQAQELYALVKEKVESGEVRTWLEHARENRMVAMSKRFVPPSIIEKVDLADVGLQASKAGTEFLVGQIGGLARNIANVVVSFFGTLIILFFFFRDGERMVLRLRDVLPMEARHKDAIFAKFYETMLAVVQGMTVTALAQALLSGLAFWVLDVPFWLLLALTAGLASFIPLGGAALIWVPAAIWLAIFGWWGHAIALALWGTLVISVSDNIIRPLIIGEKTGVSTLFLFFGILGGLQAYGVLGVFLGPALLATIVAVFRIYREVYQLPTSTLPAAEGS